jgi:hypothetical protein
LSKDLREQRDAFDKDKESFINENSTLKATISKLESSLDDSKSSRLKLT